MYQVRNPDITLPEGSEPIDIIPTLIWKFKYDFNYEMSYLQNNVGRLIEYSERKNSTGSVLEVGNSFSTAHSRDNRAEDYQPHNWQELRDFMIWLEPRVFYLWNYFDYDCKIPRPINSWINLHKKTGQTLEHMHNMTPLVVSCYLKCPEKSGNIEFRDPLEYHKFGLPYEPQDFLWNEVKVQTNDVIIFPGWLKHRTQASQSDDDRVVLTLNYG